MSDDVNADIRKAMNDAKNKQHKKDVVIPHPMQMDRYGRWIKAHMDISLVKRRIPSCGLDLRTCCKKKEDGLIDITYIGSMHKR